MTRSREPSEGRLSLTFVMVGGALSAFGPYLGLVLDRLGYSGAAIGGVLAIVPVMRLISVPLWAAVADRWRLGTRILQAAAIIATVSMTAMATGALGLWGLVAALVVFSFAWAPISPLLDGLTVQTLERAGAPPTRYGRIRLWGSVSFLVIAGGVSLVTDHVALVTAPLLISAVFLVLIAAVSAGLPQGAAEPPAPIGPALRLLLGRRGMVALLLALTLHGVGQSAYDSWYAMHISQLGLPSAWTGGALVGGVAAEIVVMAVASQILRDRPPLLLVTLAFGLAAARWALTATVTSPLLLTALQLTHGITFGVYWIGSVEAMRRIAPPRLRSSAQGLLIASTFSLGPILASVVGAALVDSYGTGSLFAVSAALSVLATGLCWVASAQLR